MGDVATSRFTCGGTLCTPTTSTTNKFGVWSGTTLPGIGEADLKQILESATVANFGKGEGEETVTDGDAYTLEPEKFCASFMLCNSGILDCCWLQMLSMSVLSCIRWISILPLQAV